ncbi:MAG: hypothetical protein ACRDE8_03575, partial [Ginsengibacter sp.]
MKPKSFLIIVLPILILFFCACNNSPGKTNTDATTSASNTKTASADLDLTSTAGSFSYTIDGKRVETVNNVQHANLFINEVSNDAANAMLKIQVTCEGSNVFDFDIANSGTTAINNSKPSLSGFANKKTKGATYMDGKTYRNLYAVSVTVNIASIDDSRVKGTFSGTFKAEQSDGGATANITD